MLTRISRLLVGALFIVSGLIKANDPIGFSYKLNDYFAPGVFDLPWLDAIALELAVIACVAEIVLGIAILFGARMKTSRVVVAYSDGLFYILDGIYGSSKLAIR